MASVRRGRHDGRGHAGGRDGSGGKRRRGTWRLEAVYASPVPGAGFMSISPTESHSSKVRGVRARGSVRKQRVDSGERGCGRRRDKLTQRSAKGATGKAVRLFAGDTTDASRARSEVSTLRALPIPIDMGLPGTLPDARSLDRSVSLPALVSTSSASASPSRSPRLMDSSWRLHSQAGGLAAGSEDNGGTDQTGFALAFQAALRSIDRDAVHRSPTVESPTHEAPRSEARKWAERAGAILNNPLAVSFADELEDDPLVAAREDALHRAATLARMEKQRLASEHIKASERMQVDREGATHLHRACRLGFHTSVADILHGAVPLTDRDINSQRNNGFTPLHEACTQGRVKIAELMLDHARLVPNMLDDAGTTAIWRAAYRGHEEVVHTLLNSRYGDTIASSLGWRSVGGLPMNGQLDATDFGDMTAAEAAAHAGHTRIAGQLNRAFRNFQLVQRAKHGKRATKGDGKHSGPSGSRSVDAAAQHAHKLLSSRWDAAPEVAQRRRARPAIRKAEGTKSQYEARIGAEPHVEVAEVVHSLKVGASSRSREAIATGTPTPRPLGRQSQMRLLPHARPSNIEQLRARAKKVESSISAMRSAESPLQRASSLRVLKPVAPGQRPRRRDELRQRHQGAVPDVATVTGNMFQASVALIRDSTIRQRDVTSPDVSPWS